MTSVPTSSNLDKVILFTGVETNGVNPSDAVEKRSGEPEAQLEDCPARHTEKNVKISDILFSDTKLMLQAEQAGGKALNLQKLEHSQGLLIPPWFVLPVDIFRNYLLTNKLFEKIKELDSLCNNFQSNSDAIKILIESIKQGILTGSFDAEAFFKVSQAYEELQRRSKKKNPQFAVRSSGVIEDGMNSSCAGLYDTILNCRGVDKIVDAIKNVWASSFNFRIIQERLRLKISQTNCLMGVIIQELVNAQASGVVSTMVLGNNYPGIQIAANYGLGESVVGGDVSTDGWIIHPTKGYILEEIKGKKETCCKPKGDIGTTHEDVPLQEQNRFSLNRKLIGEIYQQVSSIKTTFGYHVDVEFAVDECDRLNILQARPLTALQTGNIQVVDRDKAKMHRNITTGLYSIPGVATGRLVFIKSWNELSSGAIKLTDQDIALAFVTANTWTQYLHNIKGLITREGSPSSHPILLCRERKIPCVIGIHQAFDELIKLDGKLVTIDGLHKVIYEGSVPCKEAGPLDLEKQFETIAMRQWPDLNASLPHLMHSNMAVLHEGKYWRRTPTYLVKGFQTELNMRRFAIVPSLINKAGQVRIVSKVIDGYTCNTLEPFENYVALFDGFSLQDAAAFNHAQWQCTKDFCRLAETFSLNPASWMEYIEIYARFRAYIWLGGAYRSYAERRVDELGIANELPGCYLDECASLLQAEIPEIDIEMAKEVYSFAERLREEQLPEKVNDLKLQNPSLFSKLEELAKKYRFEHTISLDKPIDLDVVYQRVKQEVDSIKRGSVFSSNKQVPQVRSLLSELADLKEWLRLSIWNRILQSDAHQLDARARALVRPKLLELGQALVNKQVLDDANAIFNHTVDEIAQFMKGFEDDEKK